MALLIINLTPASAFDMAGIQNNVNKIDNYAHADWWYKFWHFFDLTNAMASLVSQVIDTANELPSDLQKGVVLLPKVMNDRNELDARNEKLNTLSKYYSNDTLKSDWVNDTDETNDVENNATNNNTPKTNNLTEETNTNVKKIVQPSTNVSNLSNSSGNHSSNNKLSNNAVVDESNISNKTKNTSNASTPPKEVVDHAAYIQKQLKGEGIDVNVVHHNLHQLKKNDLVQLVDIQGYIKYMVYEGNTSQDGNPAFILYNGQNDQIVTYNKFMKAYTGLGLELSNNNDTNITTVDVAEKIYSTHLNGLIYKINDFNLSLAIGTDLEWIGASVIGLSAIVGAVIVLIGCCFPKCMAGFITALTAILVIVVCIVGAAILVAGIIIVNVIQKNSDDAKAEKDDLTNQCI